MNDRMLRKAIELITVDIRAKVDIAVIGLSGGADSTLVAALCANALGRENVYGVGMPYNSLDEETFNDKSAQVAKRLGITYDVVPIGAAVNDVTQCVCFNGQISQLNAGNLRSRIRMVTLYTYACSIGEHHPGKKCRVMGTGNLSEDFIGYDTKGGDALGDIFPIGELLKKDVYNMLDMFVADGILVDDLIDRVPSAGLWDGQTDEDELGMSYDEMAPAVKYLVNNYMLFNGITTRSDFDTRLGRHGNFTEREKYVLFFVWDRHIKNKHKHEAPYVTPLEIFRRVEK